jgi:hypothetical protein
VVKTSAGKNITVGGYIDRIKDITTVEKWFDTSSQVLLRTPLNRGAGQVRMASRLAYMAAMGEGKLHIINNAISSLLRARPAANAGNNIEVSIICSLAGGTGAGSFLQMAYYLKDILKNDFHLQAPNITGYFLLGNVLYHDSSTGFNADQKENTLSNTYASIKELNAFITRSQGSNIEFEYKIDPSRRQGNNLNIPIGYAPYDMCYLIDFHSSIRGKNLGQKENYYKQIQEFLYLNSFSPIAGHVRAGAINNIRQQVGADGAKSYSSFGVSKIIYPVDDILAYFASEMVAENLSTTWTRIDRMYQEKLLEYKRKVDEGFTGEPPLRDDFFIDNIEALAKGASGRELIEYKRIYNSISIRDKEGSTEMSKARAYIESIEEFVTKLRDENTRIKGLYDSFPAPPVSFFSEKNESNDKNLIDTTESLLAQLKDQVLQFIENSKRQGVRQAIFADEDVYRLVSGEPYKLNTYILEKEGEMHPMAVRYFLYDIKREINAQLADLKEKNKSTLEMIENYAKTYDIKDDKGVEDTHVETALEAYTIKSGKNSVFYKKLMTYVSGTGELKSFKEEYVQKSKKQRERLREYAYSKLLEEMLTGIRQQVLEFIGEFEDLFDKINDIILTVNIERDNLSKKHSGTSNPVFQYVFSTPGLKRKLYEDVTKTTITFSFPPNLSRLIYEGIYHKVSEIVNNVYRPDEDKEDLALIEFFKNQVVGNQKEQLRINLKDTLVDINIINAIRYEARLSGQDEMRLLSQYFGECLHLADTLGPVEVENNRFINAWGLHPSLVNPSCLTQAEADVLFGDDNITTNSVNAAERITSELFSKHEVVRANAVFLLSILEHFPQFIERTKTRYVSAHTGSYYDAYKTVLDNMNQFESGQRSDIVLSTHLDKRWHIEYFLPDIGGNVALAFEKTCRAFYFGLVSHLLLIKNLSGRKFWRFVPTSSSPARDIKDLEGDTILAGNMNNLFEKGLLVNPSITYEILDIRETAIRYSTEQYASNAVKTDAERKKMLKETELVKKIIGFNATDIQAGDETILSVIDQIGGNDTALIIKNASEIKDIIIRDIIEIITAIGGINPVSKDVCNEILKKLNKENNTESTALINKNMKQKFN